jgi:ankyrin repeat protein
VPRLQNAIGGRGLKPLHFEIESATQYLIERGHKDVAMVPTEFAKLLIEKGADVNAKNKSGGTALMIAAGNGLTETVRLLIEKRADVKVTDENGNTALMYSVTGYVSLAKRLSKKEELKDLVSIPIEIIKLLINGGAVDAKNEDGLTAYSFALANGLVDVAQSLQPAGGLPANSPILNPQERFQFQGFSILPPQGETWTVMDSDSKSITFGRYTGERLHTIMASVRIKKHEALAAALKSIEISLNI